MSGTIIGLYIKEKRKTAMLEVVEVTADTGKGLVGDLSYGKPKRQVLFIEQETLDEFGLVAGQIKENVTVKGIALTGLPEGTELQVGEVLFEVVGDCAPCQMIEDIRPGLREEMTGRRGTLCMVKQGGALRKGDGLKIL